MAAGIVLWVRYALPPPPRHGRGNTDFWPGLAVMRTRFCIPARCPMLLFPFRLVVAPCFAPNAGQFLIALGPALAVMGLLYWWVIRSNVAFEEASVELSRKTAERMAAIRSGNWQAARKPKKAARSPFQLRPSRPSGSGVVLEKPDQRRKPGHGRIWVVFGLDRCFCRLHAAIANRGRPEAWARAGFPCAHAGGHVAFLGAADVAQ